MYRAKRPVCFLQISCLGNAPSELGEQWRAIGGLDEDSVSALFCLLLVVERISRQHYPVVPHSSPKMFSPVFKQSLDLKSDWAKNIKPRGARMTLILHQGPTIPFLYSHIGTSHLNTHVLSSGSTHYSVRNERKCKTSPDPTMLKMWGMNSWIWAFLWIHT